MKRNVVGPLVLATALALLPGIAQACSEGMFNTGKGLAYQGYLAPRPANVLIYASEPAQEREALYSGLQKAGHTLTVVHDDGELAAALGKQHYDVVITALDDADQVASSKGEGQGPQLLPVVARSERDEPQVRDRFEVFLIDGASLGQYLGGINKVLKAAAR